ncbi:hypothetical protein LTR53_005105 [Teratosphaeriaceae sp. CCFEE 6253]|nr:hypothetical protein LTR53_005105 [Teratosphaeriaceae sp. CCFEE 6253]
MALPWLAMTHGRCQSTLTEFITPALTVLVGRKAKSEILRHWLTPSDRKNLTDPHGQVYMWPDADTKSHAAPLVHIDYELQTYSSAQWTSPSGHGSSVGRTFKSYPGTLGPLIRRKLNNLLCARALGALSHTLCYFAADLGGPRAVAALIAQQVVLDPALDLPSRSLPRILVVVDTSARRFDCAAAKATLVQAIGELMRTQHGFHETGDSAARIALHYRAICVLGISRRAGVRQRSSLVRRKMTAMVKEVETSRTAEGVLFDTEHLFAIVGKLLDHLSATSSVTCSLISLSRPEGFTVADLETHAKEMFALLPSEIWLWHLAAPLISSSIILPNYPPSAHGKSRESPLRTPAEVV